MNSHADIANDLAERVRIVMQTDAKDVLLKHREITGVGMAWRNGQVKFVVQTESYEKVTELRRILPEHFRDFSVAVETADLAKAASRESLLADDDLEQRIVQRRRFPLFSAIAEWLNQKSKWIAFARR